MKVFSLKKYMEWNNGKAKYWAEQCDGQPVINGSVKGKNGKMYLCCDDGDWTEEVPDTKVIFSGNATVLIKDGKKYVSKCKDGDAYDKEKGLLLCLAQANGISYKDLQEMIAGAKDCNAAKVKGFNVGDKVMAKTKEWSCDGKIGTIEQKDDTDTDMPYLVNFGGVQYWLKESEVFPVEKADDKAQVREVKRKAEVGEYIKIVCASATGGCYKNGDVYEVIECCEDTGGVYIKTNKTHPCCIRKGEGREGQSYAFLTEYVVLENYKPYKITLSEFLAAYQDDAAIHCKTEGEAKALLKAFYKAGKRWSSGDKYTSKTEWSCNKEKTVYTNNGYYGSICGSWVKEKKPTIYEFNEVDLEN